MKLQQYINLKIPLLIFFNPKKQLDLSFIPFVMIQVQRFIGLKFHRFVLFNM